MSAGPTSNIFAACSPIWAPADRERALMGRFTLAEVRTALGHQPLPGDDAVRLNGLQIDSRLAEQGDLFIALRTDGGDGNLYVGDAFGRGAKAAIVERLDSEQAAARQIAVSNSLAALTELGRHFRARATRTQVIGITGSNGKTTAKEALAAALGGPGTVVKSEKSFNNELGIPVTLAEITGDTDFAVVEMGAQVVGEIASYCELARPHHGIITNTGRAHVGLFGSAENVVRAKGELADYLGPKSVLALNADDSASAAIADRTRARVVWFGREPGENIVASSVQTAPDLSGQQVRLTCGARTGEVRVGAVGRHLGEAFAAAVALGLALDLAFEDLLDGLGSFKPMAHRMQVHHVHGATILDDTYNANRESCIYALGELRRARPGGRLLAVLGDMLELGEFSAADHAAVGSQAGFVDELATIGMDAELLGEAAMAAGVNQANYRHFAADSGSLDSSGMAVEAVAGWLRQELRPGDLVLIKGSNALGLARLVDDLLSKS